MKKGISFLCPLKQKLDDYRSGYITLNQMLDFLYYIDNRFEKKVVELQKEYSKEKLKEYKAHQNQLDKWKSNR